MRVRFMRRVFLFGCVFLVLVTVSVATATAIALRFLELAGPAAVWIVPLVLVAGAALFAFAARGVRGYASPLGDVIEAAGRVAEGDLTARVRERGPREVRGLARAFNTMSEGLAASEEQRRRLLADVSHELRTPLTVVQGNLEALIDGLRPADLDHLRAILDDTKVLSRLVDDLATLSLAEAGALPLHREPTDVALVARETVASFASRASSAGVRVSVEAMENVQPVDADPVRLREIITNLVANAIRYTPADGSVRIGVRPGDDGGVEVTVADTGRGIPAESLERVFDRFYKSAESRGAGLGLAIAKQLVGAHGGTIRATSASGQGTEIRFTLPA